MLLTRGGDLGEIAEVTQHELINLIAGRERLPPFIHHLVDKDIEELDVDQWRKIVLRQCNRFTQPLYLGQ
ncbi:hypothetical protein D3C77_430410 [compost metagenome]